MVLAAWLRILRSPKPKSSSPRDRRLVLETLEDRCVPALSFTSLTDSVLGVTTYGNPVTLIATVTNSVGNPVSEGGVSFYCKRQLSWFVIRK
jgi:hypothetical protein